MFYYTICKKCAEQGPPFGKLYKVVIDSDLIGTIKCSKGHKSIVQINHFHFDVLYQSALLSYMNEFYSESLMSFAASLERTYEFYIKISLLKKKVSIEKINLFWKELNNSSERQYGAFCIEYLANTGKPWKSNQKQVTFRNKVIHKGYIANSHEVKIFAQYCLDQINKIFDEFSNGYGDEISILKAEQVAISNSKIKIMQKENEINLLIKPNYGGRLKLDIKKGTIIKSFDSALESLKEVFEYLKKYS